MATLIFNGWITLFSILQNETFLSKIFPHIWKNITYTSIILHKKMGPIFTHHSALRQKLLRKAHYERQSRASKKKFHLKMFDRV